MGSPDEPTDAELITRAKESNQRVKEYTELVSESSRERRETLDDLIKRGYSRRQLADLLGVSVSRVGQLIKSGPKPERALLGRGAVTIAIGGKHEGGRDGDATAPKAVTSTESSQAADLIASTCKDYGLDCERREIVPPPGMVDLNRANLIVIGSPRILPIVGQVLGSDPNLDFDHDDGGWYLVDRTTASTYRSPSDQGEPRDFAYLGRVPRPDGKGTFFYLAGIHAMGTLGAAHHLADHIEELYAQVKTRRWSTLVATTYDPETRAVTKTEALTPIYTQ